MSSLVVGGVPIKVAVSSPKWTRSDQADRSRSFDGTFRASQTGGAARTWDFETPPVLAATEGETYKAALSTIASQLCLGDIIAIPTMCSAELTDGTPVRVGGATYITLSFSLHEVQPAKVLLRYSPGDAITGESFTRATTAYYIRWPDFTLVSAGVNVRRDTHWSNGLRSTLLEDASTNSVLWSNDFSNAAWTPSTMTVGTGIADPSGGTTACTLTATAGGAVVYQILAPGASIVRTASIWLRRRTGTGVVQVLQPNVGSYVTVTLTAAWQRFSVTGAAGVTRQATIQIATSGDAVDAWCYQIEDKPFATSEIPTTTVAVTRAADSYSLPFTTPPGEMTAYAKFVEGGTGVSAGAVFEVSNAAAAAPRLLGYAPTAAGQYATFHATTLGSVTSTLGTAPVVGDTAELAFCLFGDGSVNVTQSINGGASTTSTISGPLAFASAWSGLLLWLNSAGTAGAIGFTVLHSFKVVAGARSLAEMRGL